MSVALSLGLVLGSVILAGSFLVRPRARSVCGGSQHSTFQRPPSLAVVVGRTARAVMRRPSNPALDRSVGRAVIVMGVLGVVHLGAAAVALVMWWAASVFARRRRRARRTGDITDGLADVIDLFAMSLLSGNNIAASTTQVGIWIDGELGAAFRQCSHQVDRGRTIADALEELPDRLGPQLRPLIGALVASERYGASITQNLAQLAVDSRADRRRRSEAAARRLPVALLFPLVTCVLPAFLVVTVVPVVIDTLSAFNLLASP